MKVLLTQERPAGQALLDAVDEYAKWQKDRTEANKTLIEQHTQKTLIISVVLSGLVLLLTAVLAALITRSIINPLDALEKAIDDVRRGGEMDALAKINSKDEFADMGFAVNQVLQEQISVREKEIMERQKAEQERKRVEAENDKLNNSVIALLQAVDQLSQKDLTVRVPLSGDIIDTVADAINQLTDGTANVLRGVNIIAGQVAQVSGNVRSQADLVAVTTEEERKNVGEMIQSLGEAAKSMNQIADIADQSNHSAERATQATSSALETVKNTVKGMDSIRETIAETEKRIKRLGERSQEISGIVNLINTISERTHVLALNASMQAAVAGDAGRGFAVVAEEVQRLAENSRSATQQIGTLVSNIQLETNETISTVNRTISQVVLGSEQAQKAGEQMRLTQEITGELVKQVGLIAGASGVQKEMSSTMLEAVRRLGQSTERTARQIGIQGDETQALIESARQLIESVSVFKLPVIA
jgi:methyl-accepting chemotaxis protein